MRTLSPWLAGLLGAAVIGVAWVAVEADRTPAERTGTAFSSDLDVSAGQVEILQRLDDVQRRLAAVERAVTARSTAARSAAALGGPRLEGRPPTPTDAEAGAGATPAAEPVVTDEVLTRTLERLEAKKVAAMSDGGLAREAERLLKQQDPEGARRMLDLLLARDLEPEERARALTSLGMVQRSLQDYAASEAALREAIRAEGADSPTGAWAGFQLVWTLKGAGQAERALVEADRFLASRGVKSSLRPSLRWAAAMLAHETGDLSRARTELRALVDELGDSPEYRNIVADASRRLKDLE